MKIIPLIVFLVMPSLIMAQNVGGEIRRPVKANTQSNPMQTQKVSTNRTNAPQSPTKSLDLVLQNLINNMVYVNGGTFMMGATKEQIDVREDEKPNHKVTLTSFSIGRYEVTQEEWLAVMGNNPSVIRNTKNPVENVSWDDCQTFISKLNELTGRNFRLPTEAEWEFAARGGNHNNGFIYAGNNDLNSIAWYYENSNNTTHKVGSKRPNELGLYDMSGNVWEWCQDIYGFYDVNDGTDPKGPKSGSKRIFRGGSYSYAKEQCRVSSRLSSPPSDKGSNLGFRLAM